MHSDLHCPSHQDKCPTLQLRDSEVGEGPNLREGRGKCATVLLMMDVVCSLIGRIVTSKIVEGYRLLDALAFPRLKIVLIVEVVVALA